MRRLTATILTMVLMLTLSGCGSKGLPETPVSVTLLPSTEKYEKGEVESIWLVSYSVQEDNGEMELGAQYITIGMSREEHDAMREAMQDTGQAQ